MHFTLHNKGNLVIVVNYFIPLHITLELGSPILQSSCYSATVFPRLKAMEDCFKDTPKPLGCPSSKMTMKPIPKNFKCTYQECEKAFTRAWKLEAHIYNVHCKLSPYVCSFEGCDRRYNSKSHLQRHHKTFHSGFTLPCPYSGCLNTFTTSWAAKKHYKEMHDQLGTFLCTLCNAVFAKKKLLEKHVITHKERESLVCPICSKQWHRKSSLQQHLNSHKLKNCPYSDCEFGVESQSKLRKHMAEVHPIEYICFHCEQTFKLKPALRDHVMKHYRREERQVFSCPHRLCHREYLHERNLKQHLVSFHSNERYYCDIEPCKLSYRDQNALEAHKKRMHKIPLPSTVRIRKKALIERMTASANVQETVDQQLVEKSSRNDQNNPNSLLLIISRDSV